MHGLQWMKDKRQSHFADIHLGSEQVGTPAGLISVPWSGGNYRDLTAMLIRKWRPQSEKSLFYVIKNAVLVSTHACPDVQICSANALQRNAVKDDPCRRAIQLTRLRWADVWKPRDAKSQIQSNWAGVKNVGCWILLQQMSPTTFLSLYKGQRKCDKTFCFFWSVLRSTWALVGVSDGGGNGGGGGGGGGERLIFFFAVIVFSFCQCDVFVNVSCLTDASGSKHPLCPCAL